MNKVHYSSNKMDWRTPSYLFDYFNEQYKFTLDPCSSDENALCDQHFTVEENGLNQPWDDQVVFMNPPYGREIGDWVKKAADQTNYNTLTIALLPARTDTKWFYDNCRGREITFIVGRVNFSESENSAPFPNMIVKFAPKRLEIGESSTYKMISNKELINRGK